MLPKGLELSVVKRAVPKTEEAQERIRQISLMIQRYSESLRDVAEPGGNGECGSNTCYMDTHRYELSILIMEFLRELDNARHANGRMIIHGFEGIN